MIFVSRHQQSQTEMKESKPPTLTVLTPTFNRAKHLFQLYTSIVQNDFIKQWIVVDDGSTDETKQTIEAIRAKKEASLQLLYIRTDHGGMKYAINTGLGLANCEYICKIDSDDRLLKEFGKTYAHTLGELIRAREADYYHHFSFGTASEKGRRISCIKKKSFRHNTIVNGHVLIYARHRLYEQVLAGDLLDIFRTDTLKEHFRYPIISDCPHTPTGIMHLAACIKGQGQKHLYIDVPCLNKNYLDTGISRTGRNSLLSNPKSYAISAAYELCLQGHTLGSFTRSLRTLARAVTKILIDEALRSIRR